MLAAELDELRDGVLAGNRRAIARAITLVESRRLDHREDAGRLLNALLANPTDAVRLGITGSPGVGKSTFIERFGLSLVELGHRLAVLAVDPSSGRSGGSILGDKTRMEELARHPNAFIRPTPSGGTLGGLARRSREAMLVCEAAGFDVVLVETVGVGQSETEVDDTVDLFVLLVAPGGGDELQGIKRGVMELADLVVVTKADGDLLPAARKAAADYRHALHLLRPKHDEITTEVCLCSSVTGDGIDEVWEVVVRQRDALVASGTLARRRADQDERWFWSEVQHKLVERLRRDPSVAARAASLQQDVREGKLSPVAAADALLAELE